MSNRICKKCKSRKVVEDGCYAGSTFYRCENCKEVGMQDNFPKQTIFDQITQSYEMLAEKLVYKTAIEGQETVYDWYGNGVGVRSHIYYVWKSSVTGDDTYTSEKEAIAATVVKLKEVTK